MWMLYNPMEVLSHSRFVIIQISTLNYLMHFCFMLLLCGWIFLKFWILIDRNWSIGKRQLNWRKQAKLLEWSASVNLSFNLPVYFYFNLLIFFISYSCCNNICFSKFQNCIISFNFSISAEKAAEILTKMCLKSEVLPDGKRLEVVVPPTRAGD